MPIHLKKMRFTDLNSRDSGIEKGISFNAMCDENAWSESVRENSTGRGEQWKRSTPKCDQKCLNT